MKPSFNFQLVLIEKIKFEGTDVMSFKFNQHLDKLQKYQTPSLFEYTAGQYAYFNLDNVGNNDKGLIRHFTISSSPTENFIMLSTKIRESQYKHRLSTLEVGDKVKVSRPEGEFVLPEDYSKPLIFLSGGIGVTPFRSMISYTTDKQLPLKIIMFDSNKNQQNILFKKEFDDWTTLNDNLKIIYTLSEEDSNENSIVGGAEKWKGEIGRIDKELILRHVDTNMLGNSTFYVCGPPDMLKSMQSLLENELEIPKERIKVEEFTGY
ncbi:MAG: FAD-dependent oxidoreductase [Thermoproteota archaeon]|nr:FAD-dependent oxidoreductase [Thermoproteota archaeon]